MNTQISLASLYTCLHRLHNEVRLIDAQSNQELYGFIATTPINCAEEVKDIVVYVSIIPCSCIPQGKHRK